MNNLINRMNNMDINRNADINMLNDLMEYMDINSEINKIINEFHYRMIAINNSRGYVKLLSKMIGRIKKLDDCKEKRNILKEFENEYGEHLVNYCSYYLD